MVPQFSSLALLSLFTIPLLVSSTPVVLPRADGPGHPYQCEAKYNAPHHKQDLKNKGANAQDLAIAIMESSCAMSGTAYPFGDKTPDGKPKTGDSANFGLFKNNWGNIRKYCSEFKGRTQEQWKDGAVL
ncbi:MAG: hypothetical protein Q9220_006568, partial [cf. Caloplaca sp. 1 TL-2023]